MCSIMVLYMLARMFCVVLSVQASMLLADSAITIANVSIYSTVTGPAIAVHKSSRPNILVTKLLTGVELLAPTMAIANNLDTHRLSHDPKVAEELDASEYNIAYMTLRTGKCGQQCRARCCMANA